MSRYDNQILDNYGRPVPGASVYVYDDAGALDTLTDDLAAPIDNPLTSDANGLFAFNAADGEKTLDVWFGGIRRWREEILVGPPDPGPTGPAGDVAKADSRAAVAAIVGQAAKATRWLAEIGREGMFVFDGGDLSAMVTADPNQGIYVAPAIAPTGAAGAWIRKFSGWFNVKWFGATGDGVTNDSAAFVAAIAYLKTVTPTADPYYKGSPRLFVPSGTYYLGATTLDLSHALIIEGDSSLNGHGTRLVWGENATGIRIQDYNTSGIITDGAPHFSGSYAVLRNLGIIGPVAGSEAGLVGGEAEYHGIHARSNVIIEDCYINGFRGDGVHAITGVGAGGAVEGNSNCSFINRLRVTNVRNGVYLDGADANAWTLNGVIGTYCRQHTIWDSSFLGNTHIGHHSANAGLVPGVPASVVSHGGNLYCVKQGQAAGASVNAPSGTTADNAWWLYMSAGGVNLALNNPAWVNGVSVREGGGYRSDSLNGYNVFIGCYQEGGEGFSQFVSPTAVIGGLITPKTNGNVYQGDRLVAPKGVILGQSLVAEALVPATPVAIVQNSSVLQNNYTVRFGLAQGANADGTPCVLGALVSASLGADPATNKGILRLAVRNVGGGFVDNDMLTFDPYGNQGFYPEADNALNLGFDPRRYKGVFGYTGDFTTQVKIAGNKVLGAQGAAVADPGAITSIAGVNAAGAPTQAEFNALVAVVNAIRVDLAATRTQLVATLARLRAATGHGLIA